MALKVLNSVICDEVRREDNGKHILIGVYNSAIVTTRFPIALALTLWVQFVPEKAGVLPLAARLLGPKDAELASSAAHMKINAPVPTAVAFTGLQVVANDNTMLRFQVKFENEPWIDVREIEIRSRLPTERMPLG